ncbi:hypothetical protein DSCA_29430 [Desulfosarcina alkanivorans]|uniref:DinB-like domain-containing protein n=1 Tax=Desulfosarcina alkanivorans TaxID=571177 RepID=A0A5K7YKG0_9BACT|nr:hypothetical protein [Desulfosarcina alkanivorans]BBO69013.1 hypothetical protein DSCA_29430 [Desulfosarcina alkanivorans]
MFTSRQRAGNTIRRRLEDCLALVDPIDPAHDVMPSARPGIEQVGMFRDSVEDHLESISQLSRLRGTPRKKHPVFGDLDAHGWNCMFGFHLSLHLRQARQVVKKLNRASMND